MEKMTYNMKELADLLDIGETTLQNQVIPVIRAVMSEIIGDAIRSLIDQRERIEFLEDENRELYRRLAILEAHLFPEQNAPRAVLEDPTDPDMVDLEMVLGIEMEPDNPAASAE